MCLCVCTNAVHLCGVQRTAFGSQSSPSTLWVPGIELRTSGFPNGGAGAPLDYVQNRLKHAFSKAPRVRMTGSVSQLEACDVTQVPLLR